MPRLKIVNRPDTGSLEIRGTVAGVRIRRRPQSDNRRLAAEEAATIEADLLKTAWHGERRGARSFAAAVDSYLEADNRPRQTKRLLLRIMDALGDVKLADIDQDMITRVRHKMLGADVGPATIARSLIVPIRAVMIYAADLGWCDRPRFKTPTQPKGRIVYLLPAEARRLITAAAPHLRPLLLFLLCTGARLAEALELDWRDVDLAGGRAIFWDTKNGDPRNAELPPAAVAALSCLKSRAEGGRVFRTDTGVPYADKQRQSGGQIDASFKTAVRRAGLDRDKFTPHATRHTWSSWHYAIHRDLLLLKRDGGWRNAQTCERYAHLLPAGHEAEIKKIWHGADTEVSEESASDRYSEEKYG
jgi:integrase